MEDNSQPKSAAQSALSISEAAHRNHEEWFPLHKSTLKITDPDLIEIFDNFAFDEVIAYGTHIAIVEQLNGKAVDWMEKVTDEEYFAYQEPKKKDAPPAGKER